MLLADVRQAKRQRWSLVSRKYLSLTIAQVHLSCLLCLDLLGNSKPREDRVTKRMREGVALFSETLWQWLLENMSCSGSEERLSGWSGRCIFDVFTLQPVSLSIALFGGMGVMWSVL